MGYYQCQQNKCEIRKNIQYLAVISSAKSYDKLKKGLPKELKPLHRKIFDLPEVCNKRIIVFAYDAWKVMAAAYGDKTRSKKKNVPLQNFFGDSVRNRM